MNNATTDTTDQQRGQFFRSSMAFAGALLLSLVGCAGFQVGNDTIYRPDVPVSLARVIARALRQHPDHRYQSASDMQLALAQTSSHISTGF